MITTAPTIALTGILISTGLMSFRSCSNIKNVPEIGQCYAYREDVVNSKVRGLIFKVTDIDKEHETYSYVMKLDNYDWCCESGKSDYNERYYTKVDCP